MGILLGIRLTKDILNLPDFVQHILSYHYHSVVIITVTFFCAHTVSSFLKDKLSKSGDKAATTSILTTVVDLCVYLMGVLFILSSYGISISPLLTALAPAAWHRLALQDTLANLFSGITTLVSKQVHMGDYIRLASGEAGRVVDMNWRNTTIRTATGNMVIVPNKSIATATLTNYEQPLAECTISIPLTITYDNDLQHVEDVTLGVAAISWITANTASPASSPSSAMTDGGIRHFLQSRPAYPQHRRRSRPQTSVHQTDLS